MDRTAALAEIQALDTALEAASEAILAVAERGLELAGRPHEVQAMTDLFSELLGHCGFQDLAGQRLARLAEIIHGESVDARPDARLLNGPANTGGLDQAAADALFHQG